MRMCCARCGIVHGEDEDEDECTEHTIHTGIPPKIDIEKLRF